MPRVVRPMVLVVLVAAFLVPLGGVVAAGASDPSPSTPAAAAAAADGDGGAAEEQDLISFGIAPADADGADNRSFIELTAPAGSIIYDHVALLNQDDAPIDLNVYGADIVPGASGGAEVRARAEDDVDAGSWITIEGPETVSVAEQTAEHGYGYTVVPIAIAIPANAQPGDHIGAVVASVNARGQGGDGSPGIDLEQRVAMRVNVRVAGELEPGLTVTDVTATFAAGSLVAAGSAEVTYTVTNTGNVRMAVEPSVEVAGPLGLLARTAAGERVDELLPGGTATLTTTVPDVWPLIREDVTVAATGVAPPGGADPGVGTVTATTQIWAIPWALIAVLVLLTTVAVLYIRWRRRRARRSSGRRVAPRGGRRAARAQGRSPVPAPADDAVPVAVGPER